MQRKIGENINLQVEVLGEVASWPLAAEVSNRQELFGADGAVTTGSSVREKGAGFGEGGAARWSTCLWGPPALRTRKQSVCGRRSCSHGW